MENVLHAHHVTLKTKIAKQLTGPNVDAFLVNLSIACADAMEVVAKMATPTTTSAQEALLGGCNTAYTVVLKKEVAVGLMADMKALPGCEWFDFAKLPPKTDTDRDAAQLQDKGAEAALNPKVISFNAVTGKPENKHMSATKE